MAANVVLGDLTVTGRLSPKLLDIPANTITDAGVSSSAAIDTNKLRHRYRKNLSQPNTTATTETRVVHVVRGATGTIRQIVAGLIAICAGAATVTVDLKKNGTSVLSSVITMNSSNTNRVAVSGSLNGSLTGLVVGDVLEIVVTATAGGGTIGTGFFADIEVDEDNA